jgi:hypothetical protein
VPNDDEAIAQAEALRGLFAAELLDFEGLRIVKRLAPNGSTEAAGPASLAHLKAVALSAVCRRREARDAVPKVTSDQTYLIPRPPRRA